MSVEAATRRSHYEPLSHDALVAIVVELLDERDRLVAAAESPRASFEARAAALHIALSQGGYPVPRNLASLALNAADALVEP